MFLMVTRNDKFFRTNAIQLKSETPLSSPNINSVSMVGSFSALLEGVMIFASDTEQVHGEGLGSHRF